MRVVDSALIIALALLNAGCVDPLAGQSTTQSLPAACAKDILSNAGMACTFSHAASQPDGILFEPDKYQVGTSEFEFQFVFDDGEARLVGNLGVEPVQVHRAISLGSELEAIQFIEVTATGTIQVTAVDAYLNAVHSRHTLFDGTLTPSQYYGRCRCLN